MRMEVHVHGTIHLRSGIHIHDINEALQPWLEYLGISTINDAKSIHHDEPGIHFDRRNHVLDICWSGDVGRSFTSRVEPSIRALCPLSEVASEIEISYYDDDGNDEMNIIFIGPTTASIHDAQRRRMAKDVSDLLIRHFDEPAINEVVTLVNNLFARDWEKHSQPSSDYYPGDTPSSSGNRHLH